MAGLLSGKVALVTGASSGIGEGIALSLAEAGATVAVSARRADRLEQLVAKIEAAGGKALALPGDMVDEAVATVTVEQTIAQFGQLDILVNSAGIMQVGGIENANTAEYRRTMDINLFGTLYTCKAAIGHMKGRGTGDIINITSLAGRKTGGIVNGYSASKHAANAMTDSMRQEVGGFGVRVSILMPGATESEVAESVSDPNFKSYLQNHVSKEGVVQPSDIGDTIVLMCALPRRAHISEVTVRPTNDTTA
ncbi:SDR family NAD(P)-dependent oxidoreductase [Sphingobium sufflavum]|jgi:NADP-dependent 3-hydroxy acid dehydrogenase YdfG|uniref:SDR family oxidoreductase n=1 Tax=Sphingobium sufflavum TaxID=1129547 RepID=UPI001F2C4C00|nr:SDR family NAD(P)-dependent oxidoreductase [Sphingobium sufflavum]MCE7795442.1 SDR family NAD(P)-dependent oxidoreductase [Sphingobium sufflavum]